MLTVLAVILVTSPQAAAFPSHPRGTEAHQASTLGDDATEYWEGVRWADGDKCAKYIENVDLRVALLNFLSDPKVRLTDATIVQAELGPTPKGDDPRPAVVLVRLEVVDLDRNRYETATYAQHWHEIGQEWFVDIALSPLGTDRPWVIEPAPAAATPPAPPSTGTPPASPERASADPASTVTAPPGP